MFQWKKIERDSDDFWHGKLTLKVKFWHFLKPPHYTNSQNSIIVCGMWVCWFLGKNLSNFVPPTWKLDNPYYHNEDLQEEFCQNQEDTAFEDPFENSSQNLSENNDLSLENFSTSASSSKNRKITKISSQITGLEVD